MNNLNSLPAFLAAILVSAAASAAEPETDCKEPVDINADYSDTSISTGQTVLTGNVSIRQCGLHIQADKARVYTAERAVQKLELQGEPVRLDQNDADQGEFHATAREVEYDLVRELIILRGSAYIAHPQGEVSGEYVRYDLRNERFQGGGESEGDRIKIRLEPPENNQPENPDTNPDDQG